MNKFNEVLDSLNSERPAVTTAEWITKLLEKEIERRSDIGYGSGRHLKDYLERALKLVSKKFNIPENSFKIEDHYQMRDDGYGDTSIEGTIKLNGYEIVIYSSHGDGYGFGGKVNEDYIRAVLSRFLKPASESFQLNVLPKKCFSKMKTFFEWLENTDSDFHSKIKEAEEKSKKTQRVHSVVLVDGEYLIVPTASIETDPEYQGKVVYTVGWSKKK